MVAEVKSSAERRGFVVAITLGIGLFFVGSGLLKTWHPSSLSSSMEFVGLYGMLARGAVAVVVGTELLVGIALMYRGGVGAVVVALAMPGGYTVLLMVFLTVENPPSCGCLGLVQLFESHRAEALFGLGRNLLLMSALMAVVSWTKQGRNIKPVSPLVPDA